jgi:hypothetical protein
MPEIRNDTIYRLPVMYVNKLLFNKSFTVNEKYSMWINFNSKEFTKKINKQLKSKVSFTEYNKFKFDILLDELR